MSARLRERAWERWIRVVCTATLAFACFAILGQALSGAPLRYAGPTQLALLLGSLGAFVFGGLMASLEFSSRDG